MSNDTLINAVNAMGTLAAVVLALWLAIAATRKEKTEAQVRAKLAAASISARLSATADAVGAVLASVDFLDERLPVDVARHKALARVKDAMRREYFRPDDATLLLLTPLPNDCAHRIARAFDYIDRVRLHVRTLSGALVDELIPPDQREHLLRSWRSDLNDAHDLLRAALTECTSASELGAPLPSGEELYGPSEE